MSRIKPVSNRHFSRYGILVSALCAVLVTVLISGCPEEAKTQKEPPKKTIKKAPEPKKTEPVPVAKKEKRKPIAVVKTRPKKEDKPLTPQDRAIAILERFEATINKNKDELVISITIDNNPSFKDEQMEHIRAELFPNLQELNVSYTGISDKGLAHLPEFDVLIQVFLRGNNITDKGMRILGKIEYLSQLCIDGSQITDKGVSYLKNSETLHLLHIRSRNKEKITDACIDDMLTMRSLTELAIGGTAISEAGIKKIRKSLPECELNLEPYDIENFRGR